MKCEKCNCEIGIHAFENLPGPCASCYAKLKDYNKRLRDALESMKVVCLVHPISNASLANNMIEMIETALAGKE